jgi:HEAT repeat protein
MLAALSALGVAGLVAGFYVWSVRDLKVQWRKAAADAGLEDVAASVPFGARLFLGGHRGTLDVRVSGSPASRWNAILDITVEGLRALPPTLALYTRSMSGFVDSFYQYADYQLGDPAFDETFLVLGRPEVTLGVLDKDLRADLCALASRGGVKVEKGRITLRLRPAPTRRREAAGHLQAVLSVAQSLSRPAQLPATLEARFEEEPMASVRLQQVRTLARSYQHDPRARATLVRACSDPSDQVRIQAARALGEEGQETLLEIAERPGLSEPVAVRAIEALGASLPAQRGLVLLDHSLRAGRRVVARALLVGLGRRGGTEVVRRIATVLAVEHAEMATAAAEALGLAGGADAEAALVAALERSEEAVRRAAALALGKAGTARAIPLLQAAAKERPAEWWFRRDVQTAVAAIQARLLHADRGQLSLAEPEGGDLSLALDGPGSGHVSEVASTGDEGDSPPK